MKKITALLMALILTAAGLCACGQAASTTETTAAAAATEAPAGTEAPTTKAPETTAAPTTEAPATEAPATEAPEAESTELIVFAAASMTETLTKIGELYKEAAPGVEIAFNFDSSGTLKTQIQEGADCDVFISAAPKQMNQLDASCDAEKNPDGLDFVLQGSRINLLENKVALAVPEGNPKNINSYDDLVAGLKDGTVMLAMGNSDVPVGQYTQKIFAWYELDEAELAAKGVLTYGSNVKEVTTQVSEGTVDAGIIYATDAFSAALTVVDTATKEMCGQVIYPAAVLNITKNQEEAQKFLDFLTTDEASAVFESVGFTALSKAAEPAAETAAAAAAAADLNGHTLAIYCGAGMTKPFQEIADAFKALTGCEMEVTFANAAQIQTQINTAKEGDLFIAGSEDELKPVEEAVSASEKLVKHIPVIAVQAGNPKNITGLKDLGNGEVSVIIGDPEATPIGKIAVKAFEAAGITDAVNLVANTATAPAMVTALAQGEADAAIVWKENCDGAEGVEILESADMEKFIKVIPAASLKYAADADALAAFLEYLNTEEARTIWQNYGYELAQ